jgi:hypothetical protein
MFQLDRGGLRTAKSQTKSIQTIGMRIEFDILWFLKQGSDLLFLSKQFYHYLAGLIGDTSA